MRFVPQYAALFLVLCCASPAQAQTSSTESTDEWQFTAAFYFWGTDVGGQTISGSEVDVDFSDIRDRLDTGFMGSFGARKNDWSMFTDVIYFDLGASRTADLSIPVGPIEVPVTTATEFDMKGWILHFGGGHELYSAGDSRLDLVGGLRSATAGICRITSTLAPASRISHGRLPSG